MEIGHIHELLHDLIEVGKNNSQKLDQLLKGQKTIMAGISDIQAAQATEKQDLVTLTGFITQLLGAFATGQMTPAQAQATLDEINAEDATVKTNINSIQAALAASGTQAGTGSGSTAAPGGSTQPAS